jgi:biopolymer transport protein ExbD
MPAIRRNDLAPRVEMMPLIDVIFLLLTFFIYSLIVMVRAQVLPVQLTTVGAGGQAAAQDVQAVSIDRQGKFFFNRNPVSSEELGDRLAELAKDPAHPRLYLAMEALGDVDRGPLFLHLLERVQAAGITNFAIVGQPSDSSAGPTATN